MKSFPVPYIYETELAYLKSKAKKTMDDGTQTTRLNIGKWLTKRKKAQGTRRKAQERFKGEGRERRKPRLKRKKGKGTTSIGI
jgi:hypothetical protein